MQKAEQTLKADVPGVAIHKIVQVVDNFSDKPLEVQSVEKDNSSLLGFKGRRSRFSISVDPVGQGFFKEKPKGETDIYLYFQSDCDIKMLVEWSASITDPFGKPLDTSTVLSTIFERKDGKYDDETGCVVVSSGQYGIRVMEDAKFGLHKDIKEKSWLFDGALHVAVNLRFKVLEGGYPKTRAAVDPFLSALRKEIDNPRFADFTIVSADGEKILAHKLTLKLQSPVFRAMFENDLEEARTGICKIEDANAKSIKAMLAFLVGVEPEEWSFDLAKGLFQLADKYQVTELRTRSAVELSKKLTTKNVVEVLLLAYRHSEGALLNEGFLLLEDNVKEAILDGVIVRLASKEVPEALAREWQSHWFRRQNGFKLGASTSGISVLS